MPPSRPRRSDNAKAMLLDEIVEALSNAGAKVWAINDDGMLCSVRVTHNIKVEFNKSVFTPVERMEKRTFAVAFSVRAVPRPTKGEPDLTPLEVEAGYEREHAFICIAASSAEEALARLRARGLPL